jgi:hypothetical protein
MDRVFTGLIFWGALVAVALAVVTRVRVLWRGARLINEGVEIRCRGCGYAVCRGAGRTCPECGGDLREVGVIGPMRDRPIYPHGAILGGGILLAAPAILAGFLLQEVLPPMFTQYSASVTIPTTVPARDSIGGPNAVVEVTASGHRTNSIGRPETISVLWWAYSDAAMRWEVDTGWTVARREWKTTTRPWGGGDTDEADRDAVERFVALAGFDRASPAAAELTDRILDHVDRFRRAELPHGEVTSTDGRRVPAVRYYGVPLWYTFALGAVIWLPCWWLASRLVTRHYARALRQAREKEQAALDEIGVAR